MEELIKFLIKEISGSEDFEIQQNEDEGRLIFNVVLPNETIGLIIGKGGNTIKSIQDIVRIKGRLEEKSVFVDISQKTS